MVKAALKDGRYRDRVLPRVVGCLPSEYVSRRTFVTASYVVKAALPDDPYLRM